MSVRKVWPKKFAALHTAGQCLPLIATRMSYKTAIDKSEVLAATPINKNIWIKNNIKNDIKNNINNKIKIF